MAASSPPPTPSTSRGFATPGSALPVSVAAGSSVTAEVGAEILQRGGTAADAAVAMVLASCVAETVFTGLGGGGFATYFDASTNTTTCLDFFVAVPGLGGRRAVAPHEISIDFGGQLVPYAVGPATVAVPGVPAGAAALHERWGSLPWSDLVAPAIAHAKRGVTLAPPHAKVLATVAPALLIGVGLAAYATDGIVLGAIEQRTEGFVVVPSTPSPLADLDVPPYASLEAALSGVAAHLQGTCSLIESRA